MTQNNAHINKELLVKYLFGEVSLKERQEAKHLINSNDLAKDYYKKIKKLWEAAEAKKSSGTN